MGTLNVTHTTAADGSFSGTGAAEWNRAHSMSGGTATRVLYVASDGTIADDAGLTYNDSTNFLSITGGILNADGAVSAPSYSFTSDTDSGMWFGSGRVRLSNNGVQQLNLTTGAIVVNSLIIGLAGGGEDVVLAKDAADILALKRSTNAQTFNHYGSEITSGTRYSRLSITHATTTLASVSGATVTATNLIPAKANVFGVNTVVTVGLGTTGGTTGYTVGDGSDADRWGSVTGTAAGTDTDGNDATADPTGYFNAANNVVITAAGGNFDGTGSIFVDVAYWITEAD